MGVMLPETQLCVTPHPVTLEGQRHMVAAMEDREKLGAFLARTVPEWDRDCWEVRINGQVVPHEILDCVRPKDGTLIEVRGVVRKQALYIIAFAVLTYFTMGIGAAAGGTLATGAGIAGVVGGMGGMLLATAVFVAGSVLINKVLGPKVGKAGGDREQGEVYRLGAARNRARPYEPVGLLFGKVRIAPDYISQPYTWYEADQQFLSLILTPGINVHHVEDLYNGDALLSAYNPQVWYSGFSGMPEQKIPFYSNADTVAGGELTNNGPFIFRTTSPNTTQAQIDLEGMLYDVDKHGTIHGNNVPVYIQWRPVGGSWQGVPMHVISNSNTRVIRRTYTVQFPTAGHYEVGVRLGQPRWNEGSGKDECRFSFTTMKSIQPDNATYQGISRIGIKLMATGQLNGAPDEIRCVAVAEPIPVWNGTQWVTEHTSNPGAQILAYARGIHSGGQRVAGMGMPDHKIDIPALQAFMLHCAANGYTYDYWLTEPRNHDEVLNSIARAGFGQITRANGKLSIVWAADEQPLSGVVNMATIKKGSFQVDYTFANAADGIEATWFDAEAWETKTLRVPAPGVTTMLNPAQLQIEGVTNEAHAAQLARWHLAQSLYQYKDISYNTDIEHLSYRRLSMLALQHDLTQWGYGGRLVSAVNNAGVVTLTLDETVPAPAAGNAFIGLRIPGERVYRVFGIVPFTGESDTLTLVGAWPSDAALPGNSDGNPAHDTIWTYDFKQTPGLRVRVVAIEPESDLKGARVAVVPEGPEFWNYVKNGEYIPAAGGSLLQTRPVASNLKVTEQQVVQGDTVFTELSVAFDISGPVGETIVSMAGADGILSEVARTTERSATWRIPGAGTYTITVRPFSPEGQAGVAASIVYTTLGADAPPVLVDMFDVEQRGGGVRLYTWGWLEDTIQSADFAGVEIRYVEGAVPAPVWDDMLPVGETGYHTAPFEAVIPESGTWTFACRSRNTSGTLSVGVRVISRTLEANLGEVIGGIEQSLDWVTQQQVADQERLDQEIADRLQADIAVAAAAGADATAKANAAREAALAAAGQAQSAADAAQATADALAAEVGEIVNAPDWSATEDYIAGWLVRYEGGLYRARVANTNVTPHVNPQTWENIGQFASAAEAAAAALELATTTATELAAESQRLDAVVARMPVGTDSLATQAMVTAETTARTTAVDAVAGRVSTVEGRMPIGTGQLATAASVTAAVNASVTRDNALGTRIGVVEARMPTGTDNLANEARVVAAESAAATATSAVGQRVGVVEARMPAEGGLLETKARVDQVHQASVDRDGALAQDISVVSAQAGSAASTATSAMTAAQNAASIADSAQTTAANAQSTATNALSTAEGAALSITQVRSEARDPFTSGYGWEFTANHRGFYAVGASLGQWPATANDGASVVESNSNDPQFISPIISVSGNANPVVRAMVRRRDAGVWDGRLFWSNGRHGFNSTYSSTVIAPIVGEWEILEWDMRTNADFRSGAINQLRFDFAGSSGAIVDVKWIALGNYGAGRAAQVTQNMRTNVGTVTGRLNATYGFAVDVNNHVIGMRAANDGAIGRIDFVGDAIGFFPPAGSPYGLEITPGNTVIRQFGDGWQRIFSAIPFGPDRLVHYFGPNVGIAAASKANAKRWEDANGDLYTGGQVLQGVLRGFGSTQEVHPHAEVYTGNIASNGKVVAVTGRLRYSASQTYPNYASQATLTNGRTAANVVLERRYRNAANTGWDGGWVALATDTIIGTAAVQNESDGPSLVYWNIGGDVLVTDVADTRRREYRLRLTGITRQNHTVTNPGNIPALVQNQYQSIESLE